jgi:hypothetical protein
MTNNYNQMELFGKTAPRFPLPRDYEPVQPDYVEISRIYLPRAVSLHLNAGNLWGISAAFSQSSAARIA